MKLLAHMNNDSIISFINYFDEHINVYKLTNNVIVCINSLYINRGVYLL